MLMNQCLQTYSPSMVVKKKGRRIRRRGRKKKKELKSRVRGKRKEERDFVSSSSKKEHGALAHNNPLFYEMVVPLRMTHTVLSSQKIVQRLIDCLIGKSSF